MESKGVWVPAVLAMAAAVIYLAFLSAKERDFRREHSAVQVLVARVDIPERTVLRPDMVEAVEVPSRYVMQDAFEAKTPSDLKLIANLVTRVRIPKGNQLTQSCLVPLSPEAGLSVKVPPGYRGTVLDIEPELKPLVKPGDRVDVMVAFDAVLKGDRREKVTATILQNVLVVAVGTEMGLGVDTARARKREEASDRAAAFSDRAAISLALSPLEAQFLFLAAEQGKLRVILRGMGDNAMHPIPMSTLRQLFEP